MDASIVGSSYVGTTLAACLADLGHDVTAVDIDEETVARLNAGETPARENGSINPGALLDAAEDVGEAVADKDGYHIVVVESTVLTRRRRGRTRLDWRGRQHAREHHSWDRLIESLEEIYISQPSACC